MAEGRPAMKPKVLTSNEIDQFMEEGYVVLHEAFPASVGARIRERLWQELGLRPDDPAGWKESIVHLTKSFEGPPFSEAFTDRLIGAMDDTMGEGRWKTGRRSLGWWPVSFPGFEKPPWQIPTEGWHIDGQQFHHHIHSPDQGLLSIFILSDIGPGDGGTAIDLGSHKIAARILNEAEPAGLEVGELCGRMAKHPFKKVVEIQGRVGDVALMHPFMRHTRSANTGKSVRFICNPCFSLKEPMNLKRANAEDYSPVERAIVEALAQAR